MKKKESSSRTYTGRICYTEAQKGLLRQNFDNWQKLFAIGYNNIGTILGSYFPANRELFKSIKSLDDSSSRTLLAFINWFPAEELQEKNLKYAITKADAANLFKTYWREQFGEYDELILEAILSMNLKEGVSIINRRQAFIDSNLNPTVIQNRFLKPLDFKGAWNESAQKWRSVISTNFGSGPKNDNDRFDVLFKELLEILNNLDQEEVNSQEIVDLLDCWPLPKATGRPTWFESALQNDSKLNVQKFKARIVEEIKKRSDKLEAEGKTTKSLGQEFRDLIVTPLENAVVKADQTDWQMAHQIPWGQIMSQRSNACLRIIDQLNLIKDNKEKLQQAEREVKLVKLFCHQMAEKLNIETYTIRDHQLIGAKKFIQYLTENSFEESLKLVEDYCQMRGKKHPGQEFLKFIYDFVIENEDNLEAAIKWHHQNEKIANARLGYVADVIKKPLRPQYGTSKLAGKIGVNDGKICLNVVLMTDAGKVNASFEVKSKRALAEILSKNCPACGLKITEADRKSFQEPHTDTWTCTCREQIAIVPRNTVFHNFYMWFMNIPDRYCKLQIKSENETSILTFSSHAERYMFCEGFLRGIYAN